MPSWLALGFQDGGSFSMGELSNLHDHAMTIMFSVIVVISYVIVYTLFTSKFYKLFSESSLIETIWSIVPAFLLVVLVVPSMGVLYMMEDTKSPSMTFKIVGHQWYWTYVVPFLNNNYFSMGGNKYSYYEYDSTMSSFSSDLAFPRLLGCGEDLYLPSNSTSRLLISSTDVIHSFAVPSLALKVDALPGRINQLLVIPVRAGLYFGQCSEICGSNHSFMPISLKVCSADIFTTICSSYLLDSVSDAFSSDLSLGYLNFA